MTKDKNITPDSNKEFNNKYPELSSISKENPFEVPDGFFETLPQKITDRVHNTEKAPLLAKLFPVSVRVSLATITTIAVIFIGFLWISKMDNDYKPYYHNDEYIEDYLLSYYDYYPAEFYTMVAESDISFEDEILSDYPDNDDELFDYILNNAEFYMMNPEDFLDDIE